MNHVVIRHCRLQLICSGSDLPRSGLSCNRSSTYLLHDVRLGLGTILAAVGRCDLQVRFVGCELQGWQEITVPGESFTGQEAASLAPRDRREDRIYS
jgi:hypothetical protein